MYYIYISDDDHKYEILSVSGTEYVAEDGVTRKIFTIMLDYNGEHISVLDRPFHLNRMVYQCLIDHSI